MRLISKEVLLLPWHCVASKLPGERERPSWCLSDVHCSQHHARALGWGRTVGVGKGSPTLMSQDKPVLERLSCLLANPLSPLQLWLRTWLHTAAFPSVLWEQQPVPSSPRWLWPVPPSHHTPAPRKGSWLHPRLHRGYALPLCAPLSPTCDLHSSSPPSTWGAAPDGKAPRVPVHSASRGSSARLRALGKRHV